MPSEDQVETGVEEVLRPEAFCYPPLKLLVCTWRLSNRQRITAVIPRLTANCRSWMYIFACSGMGKWHTPSSLDRIPQTQLRPASPSADGGIPGRKSPHISIAAKRPSGDGRKKRAYPVHRLFHEQRGSVYAYASQLDAWLESRSHLGSHGVNSAGEPLSNVATEPNLRRKTTSHLPAVQAQSHRENLSGFA